MTKIVAFSKSALDTKGPFNRALLAAIQSVAKEYGVTARMAGGKFNPLKATLKVDFEIADPTASADLEKKAFDRLAPAYGMTSAMYRATMVDSRGALCELVGFETRRKKYPLRMRKILDGSIVLFTVHAKSNLRKVA